MAVYGKESCFSREGMPKMCLLMTHSERLQALRDAFYFKEKSTNSKQNAFLPHNILPKDTVLCFSHDGPHRPSSFSSDPRPDYQGPDRAGTFM